MTVSRKHGLYGVGLGATLLGGITQQNIVTGTEVKAEASSGEIYARICAMYAQKISPSFTTRSVAAALGASGTIGASIAAMSGGLALYAQLHLAGGTRATGSTHRKYGFTAGILAPKSLSVDHRGDATLGYDAAVTYDGSNDPVTITDASALPSGLTDAERFTLGPLSLGGVSLPEIRSAQVDFGIQVATEGADSDIWDTIASIASIQPRLTFKGIDIEWMKAANIPLAGKVLAHATSIFYLRKRAAGGTFVANNVAEHVKFTCCGIAYIDRPIDASGVEAGECSLNVVCTYDGTNVPLIVNTASAIT